MFPKYLSVAALSLAVLAGMPSIAWAGPSSSEIILGFGVGYRGAGGDERTHRGVDVLHPAGHDVLVPVSGKVRFAGRIPSTAGGTVLAVSVDTQEGRVTVMPLERLSVESGQLVDVGDTLGTLAPRGDPSSDASHVHVSLRTGDLYLDPSGLFAAGAVSQPAKVDPKPAPTAPSVPKSTPRSTAEAVVGMPQGVSVASSVRAAEPQASGVSAREPVTAACPEVSTVGEGVSMGAGVALAPVGEANVAAAAPAVGAFRPSLAAGAPIDATKAASRKLVGSTVRAVSAAGAPAYLALIAASACSVLILSVRAFERRIASTSPVSDRLGRLLQQLRTGDTLRGLTSCPGEAAFTVPGPSSPGEVTK